MLQICMTFAIVIGWFSPVQPHGDFSVSFRIDKEAYLLGEPMIVTAELKNTSGGRRKIVFEEIDYAITIRLVIKNNKGEPVKHAYATICYVTGWESLVKTLEDQEKISFTVNAARKYPILEPGEYTIQATYQFEFGSEKVPDVWEGSVISAPQKIRVVSPEKDEDKKILQKIHYGPVYCWYDPDIFEEILKISTTSVYSKYARYYLAESHHNRVRDAGYAHKMKDYLEDAIKLYQKAIDDKFTLSDEAQLGIARCFLIKEGLETAAKEAQKVIDNFPDSNSVDEAKELLKQIREQQAKKNIETLRKK